MHKCNTIGTWLELRAVMVDHVILFETTFEAVDMSGDVGCCCIVVGMRVGEFQLSMMWLESRMSELMKLPLWSDLGEYQDGW